MEVNVFKECLHYQHKNKKGLRVIHFFLIFLRQKIFRKFEVPYIEFFVTTKCNLRCAHCSNLIPYIKDSTNIPFFEFKKELDALLEKIDCLYRLKLHGGEVLLHPELCEMISYADDLKKIKSIRLATNGTIMPSKKVLKTLAESKVVVQISDYPDFSDRAKKLVEAFNKYSVKYVLLQDRKWQDMGEIKKRELNRFDICSITRCTSLFRGKIYVCSRAAMMKEIEYHCYDCIDLKVNKREFRSELLRLYKGKYSKACFYCDGNTKFAKEIPAGEQLS